MARYMLILHDHAPGGEEMSPEQMQAIIAEYGAWAGKLGAEGRLLGSEKLTEDAGRILHSQGGRTVVMDGPFSESKELVGGFFLIEAADDDEAVEICRDCPHLKYGARIELRRVDEVASGP